MADNASRDQNDVPSLLGVSNADGTSTVKIWADPVTHRLLVDASGGAGSTVTLETPTGTVNGSNNVFTATHLPLWVFVDRNVAISGLDGMTVTGSGPYTITFNPGTPPVDWVRVAYNA